MTEGDKEERKTAEKGDVLGFCDRQSQDCNEFEWMFRDAEEKRNKDIFSWFTHIARL